MSGDDKNIDQLLKKLNLLLEKQESFQNEINQLKQEIDSLRLQKAPISERPPSIFQTKVVVGPPEEKPKAYHVARQQDKPAAKYKLPSFAVKNSLEKFIGENLINKIGIIILVIGVAIGAKYSIERQLINPLTRIILGYLFGLALLGFAIKLKEKYGNYSAVLVSGAMAIMYFITFAAYGFYALIGQVPAFVLMVAFTVFTVIASIQYNRQVIGIIGLVGGYAVPFLLSDGQGNHVVLFSYIAIINIGILIIAFKRYWKPLFYSAFILTWLIFLTWYVTGFKPGDHLAGALVFCTLFFIIFYLSFLAYKLIQGEKYSKSDMVVLLSNSFLYFALGYGILNQHDTGRQFLGLFTLANAVMHFIVGLAVFQKKLADRNLFYFISGLVLVFITIAIPVQLDGNWVTILWAGEAALLFWIGRTKGARIYEQLSYPLMVLGFISLTGDWIDRNMDLDYSPVFNIQFLSSLVFITAFGIINRINFHKKYKLKPGSIQSDWKLFNFIIPGILIFSLYGSLLLEVMGFFDQRYDQSLTEVRLNQDGLANTYYDQDITRFKAIWMMNYTFLFLTVMSFINIHKMRDKGLKFVTLATTFVVLIVFLAGVLVVLGMLRESYLEQYLSEYYMRGFANLYIRYIAFGFLALLLFVTRQHLGQPASKRDLKLPFELIVHVILVWILSSELFHWTDIFAVENTYKLGLSILWGAYALLLVVLGIWRTKKHLRIVGILLFAITLFKLFFYDIVHLNTIKKTVVFVSLGTLLLIISFLYNKYKDKINEDEA